MTEKPVFVVSACLVGLATRYDCQLKKSDSCFRALEGALCIPVCPEQLGGLPTPRDPAVLVDGDGDEVLDGKARVIADGGIDVTENFIRGAQQVLAIVKMQPVQGVFLKSKSPSCGLTPQSGVTAALLRREGIYLREF